MNSHTLIVIAGPTASGKTAAAIEVATALAAGWDLEGTPKLELAKL